MSGPRKSDSAEVLPKSPNKAAPAVADEMEERALARGNPQEQDAHRTQCRASVPGPLERVCQAAKQDKTMRATLQLHQIYKLDTLWAAHFSLQKEPAPSVDGRTWGQSSELLEEHLQDLAPRPTRGADRARPVNWVRDVDVRGCFERRIAGRRLVRLIQKWLNAKVLEKVKHRQVGEGSPQGGSASPLLANSNLHCVFDLRVQRWRR